MFKSQIWKTKQLNVRLVNVCFPLKMHKCGLCLLSVFNMHFMVNNAIGHKIQ